MLSSDSSGGLASTGTVGPPAAAPGERPGGGEVHGVPRRGERERDDGERGEPAPVAPAPAQQHEDDEAGDVQRVRLLPDQPESRGGARRRREIDAAEAVAREHEPHAGGDERGLRRVEHQHVELLDQQRGAEREDDRQRTRRASEREAPHVVAAEREQRDEHEVLREHRSRDRAAAGEDRQAADERDQGRVDRLVPEWPEQIAGAQVFIEDERRRQMLGRVAIRHRVVLREPPARERDERRRHADRNPRGGAPGGHAHGGGRVPCDTRRSLP
jgi:hypothetical protein